LNKYEFILEDDDGEIHIIHMDVKDITENDDVVGVMDTDGEFHVILKENIIETRRIL